MSGYKYYELTLPGFDGSTDETDDKVLWVALPREIALSSGPRVGVQELDFTCPPSPDDIDILVRN